MVEEHADGNRKLTYAGRVEPSQLVSELRLNPNGDTVSITPLLNGVPHGELVMFHPNGKRKESVTYVNGKQDGWFSAHDTDGTVVFEGKMTDGLKQGLWTHWYDEVQMSQQCIYENDVLSGKCTYWYIDGNLKREETYSDGKLVAGKDH